MSKVSVQVPTNVVRKLIDDNPETALELQSMACEKIAEEIMRKAAKMSQSNLQHQVDSAFSAVMSKYQSTFKFPPEAKTAIHDMIKGVLENETIAREKRFHKSLSDALTVHLQQSAEIMETQHAILLEQQTAILGDTIRQMAREEFMSVMTDVQSAIVKA